MHGDAHCQISIKGIPTGKLGVADTSTQKKECKLNYGLCGRGRTFQHEVLACGIKDIIMIDKYFSYSKFSFHLGTVFSLDSADWQLVSNDSRRGGELLQSSCL